MTRLLALVENAADAATAIAGGIDRLVVRFASVAGLAAIAAVRGDCPVTLWSASGAAPPAEAMALSDADETWSPGEAPALFGVPHWAVCVPGDTEAASVAAARGCVGIVVDGGEGPERLLQVATIAELELRRRQARALGLRFGISGAMEAPDVPRLIAFEPDLLVLGDLLRRDGRWSGVVEPERVRFARDLVGPTLPRPPQGASLVAAEHDRIFVRDWIVPLRLGAYDYEVAPQRVRFSIEAEVARTAQRASDMRDVVTYDLITDAIARATVTHVALVETIAEDVAAMILAHPRVAGVDVTVEKLDLGPGSLGCRIMRRREP